MYPVNGCTSIFEFSEDFDVHIAANLHNVLPPNPRTANNIVRYNLIDTVINKCSIGPGHEWNSKKTVLLASICPIPATTIISHQPDEDSELESTQIPLAKRQNHSLKICGLNHRKSSLK